MEIQLALHRTAEIPRPTVGGHHHATFFFGGVQRITEVDRLTPLARRPQFTDKQVHSAHAGMPVRGEIQVPAVRVEEGPHLLAWRVDDVWQSARSAKATI